MNKQDALKRLSAIENEAAELRKLIDAPDKPTPEERFWQLCENLILKIDKEKYPDYIFLFKGEKCFFEYNTKNRNLWCPYSSIWSVFEDEDNMIYGEIKSLIKKQIEEHFKFKEVRPNTRSNYIIFEIEEHFKEK